MAEEISALIGRATVVGTQRPLWVKGGHLMRERSDWFCLSAAIAPKP